MINTKVILNTPTIKWLLLACFTVTSPQYLILLAINGKVLFPGYLKVKCMVKTRKHNEKMEPGQGP